MQMPHPPAVPERGARRRKIFYPTTVHHGGGEVRAHLLDLSASGALAHSTAPPAVSGVIHLTLDGAPRSARVMWVDGNRFGLAFALPFSDAQFADLITRMGIGA